MDTIKVRIQTMDVVPGKPPPYTGMVDCAKQIVQKEGVGCCTPRSNTHLSTWCPRSCKLCGHFCKRLRSFCSSTNPLVQVFVCVSPCVMCVCVFVYPLTPCFL
jgi:hypothetical protein